jgi:hypothetical protein
MIEDSDGSRLDSATLHRTLILSLDRYVITHSDISGKPLEIDLHLPLPSRIRVYLYNATVPPGGRSTGEHKIQLIVPGQARGQRGNFDHSDGRMPVLMGYASAMDVLIVWDAGLYEDFSYSRNVQVKANTIHEAFAGNMARQVRELSNGQSEIVLAAASRKAPELLIERYKLTLKRLLPER